MELEEGITWTWLKKVGLKRLKLGSPCAGARQKDAWKPSGRLSGASCKAKGSVVGTLRVFGKFWYSTGVVKCPMTWEYWTSPKIVAIIDHIPNGWVM